MAKVQPSFLLIELKWVDLSGLKGMKMPKLCEGVRACRALCVMDSIFMAIINGKLVKECKKLWYFLIC